MSYYYFNVGFLNWWWRWRVGSRDPKVGPTTSVDHHYKLMESYNIYISIPIGGAVPNFGMDPQIMVLMKDNKFRFD